MWAQLDGQGARTARATSSSSAAPPATRSAPVSSQSIVAVFAKNPGMKLLTGTKSWPVTNWDPATAQKQMTRPARQVPEDRRDHLQLRHRRPRGHARVPGGRPQARPDRDARRERPLAASTRRAQEQLAFQLATISSRNWLGRVAARKAIAAAEGLPNKEPSIYDAAVLRGHAQRSSRRCCAEVRRAGLLPVEQDLTRRPDHASTGSLVSRCRPPASFSASRTSSRRIPGVVALKGVTFEVLEGEVHALVGENGAGKSTLMAVAAGSTLPDSGSVEIGGRVDGAAVARRGAGARAGGRLPAPLDPRGPDGRGEHGASRCRAGSGRRLAARGPWTRERLAAVGAAASIPPRASAS